MQIKPIYATVNCAPIGYDDVNVTVRINPTGAQSDAYWATLRALLETETPEAREMAEPAYEDATLALVTEVRQGDERWPLMTREELAAFSHENDPQVIAFALNELWQLRGERVSKARENFRAKSG